MKLKRRIAQAILVFGILFIIAWFILVIKALGWVALIVIPVLIIVMMLSSALTDWVKKTLDEK